MTTQRTPDPLPRPPHEAVKIGVLTSGGDAQGMNAAVRAVVRTALHEGAIPYAIYEGWQGAVNGEEYIKEFSWEDVGSILQRGGTVIGTARSADFRERWGLKAAAKNLVERGIDRLVVIGGDGTLAGTDEFRELWPELLAELVAEGELSQEVADAYPALLVVGLVGSIDNDLVGTETTIGADSALHRIVEAIDALSSTAASHQRSFVIEVMGRHCGYLALMAALAGGCDYVLVPEAAPSPGWEDRMCQALRRGREAGRRDSLVVVAEGARDRDGNPIKAEDVRRIISERLHEDVRVTILGHVQRGGAPSAFDRWMSTVLGYHAVQDLLAATPDSPATILGVRGNRVARLPLIESVRTTRQVSDHIKEGDFEAAVTARGESFLNLLQLHKLLADVPEQTPAPSGKRIGIMHIGGLAPGMNPAVRAAVRLGVSAGHTMLGVTGGVQGLTADDGIRELDWGDVDAWDAEGGAELGTRRLRLDPEQLYPIARALERHDIHALMIIGGIDAYLAAQLFVTERQRYPSLQIPMVCVPASIDNNLPRSELSIGSDTALNNAMQNLDKIKQSANAARRCFVAETMGRNCGYLTLTAGMASGAERIYLPEDGITLADLEADVTHMREAFRTGRRLFMALRGEGASDMYDTDFLVRLFSAEADGLYDVRPAVLGHVQQGGSPTPFDRILATRLAAFAMGELTRQLHDGSAEGRYVGMVEGRSQVSLLSHLDDEIDTTNLRPRTQQWLEMTPVLDAVAAPVPTTEG